MRSPPPPVPQGVTGEADDRQSDAHAELRVCSKCDGIDNDGENEVSHNRCDEASDTCGVMDRRPAGGRHCEDPPGRGYDAPDRPFPAAAAQTRAQARLAVVLRQD